MGIMLDILKPRHFSVRETQIKKLQNNTPLSSVSLAKA